MSRPAGYYEEIEAEAQKIAKDTDTLTLARILVLTQRQLEQSVKIQIDALKVRFEAIEQSGNSGKLTTM